MNKVLLIGSGQMARDYIEVLKGLKQDFLIVGRGEKSAKECTIETGCAVITGGIRKFLSNSLDTYKFAIVSVGVENLFYITKELLEFGVESILVEKPGALKIYEFKELTILSKKQNSSIFIAYNRRFYASVLKSQEIIEHDGGVTSFNFEFTEWSHIIEGIKKEEEVKEKWFLANSTHVVDLAFYLGGKPKEISTYTSGSLSWHPSASNFSGSGKTNNGSLFNYHANWESAGRWSVEILTSKHRLVFRPMEKLQIQKKGSVSLNFEESIDYILDEKYKPGLYLQTKKFLDKNFDKMCTLDEQYKIMKIYNKMANYGE